MGCVQSNLHTKEFTQTEFENENVVIEVYTDSEGMMYPSGRILEMKLFDSKELEFDCYPVNPDSQDGIRIDRRKVSLNQTQVENIERLLKKLNQTNFRRDYTPISPVLDVSIEKVLKFEHRGELVKIILRENHSNLILDKKKGIYPDALLNLLLFVEDFNKNLLAKCQATD